MERKEAEGAVFRDAGRMGCKLMVLNNLSTLLSEEPTAKGFEIVLISANLGIGRYGST